MGELIRLVESETEKDVVGVGEGLDFSPEFEIVSVGVII